MTTQAETTPQTKLAFPTAIEGVIEGLGPLVTERTRQKLLAVGLDLKRIPPAIPAERMPVYFETIAEDIWPVESRDERLRLLGLHFMRGWQHTLLGRASAAFLKLIGPHRTLPRLDRAFRTSDNYTRSTYELVNDREVLLHVNDVDGLPTYWVGLLSGGLEFLGLDGAVRPTTRWSRCAPRPCNSRCPSPRRRRRWRPCSRASTTAASPWPTASRFTPTPGWAPRTDRDWRDSPATYHRVN